MKNPINNAIFSEHLLISFVKWATMVNSIFAFMLTEGGSFMYEKHFMMLNLGLPTLMTISAQEFF